ncbi:MAG TPA: hypothetical protein VHE30_09820 [Polyangiaceae bacterium]|nr:hypothetical protein [Polyangiaceae bacterium]
MRDGRRAAARLLAATLALETNASAEPVAEPGAEPPASTRAEPPEETPTEHWSKAPSRPFVGGILEAGAVVRGRALAGYGKPHYTWGGAVLDGTTTTEFGSVAAGARLALVLLDVTVSYRKTWSYVRGFPAPRGTYESEDLRVHPRASYGALDVSTWGLFPAPAGYGEWEFEAHRLYGVPAGRDVYEEWVRGVMGPGWNFATRLGYAVSFAGDRGSAGVVGEWVTLGGRGSVFRVGPLASWAFSGEWDLGLVLTATVSSPDSLSFYDGTYGTLRLRYRFST